MIDRKWHNFLALPLEELGPRDLHEIQTEELRSEAERRKTLQARFSSTSELPRVDSSSSGSASGESGELVSSPVGSQESAVVVTAAMASLTIETTGKIDGGEATSSENTQISANTDEGRREPEESVKQKESKSCQVPEDPETAPPEHGVTCDGCKVLMAAYIYLSQYYRSYTNDRKQFPA